MSAASIALTAALAAGAGTSPPRVSAPAAQRVTVAPGLQAEPAEPRGIRVLAEARPGESWAEMARRLTGRFANADRLRRGDPARAPEPGKAYAVAFELLAPELRRETVAALLPLDRCEGSDWIHEPAPGFAPDASYEALAAWFSAGSEGTAALEVALRRAARPGSAAIRIPCVGIATWLSDARGCCTELSPDEEQDRAEAALDAPGGDLLLVPPAGARAPIEAVSGTPPPRAVPQDLLGAAPGPTAGPSPPPPPASAVAGPAPDGAPAERAPAGSLAFGRDATGDYAAYRLRAGEAIYSDVILRFTNRVHARDVNELVPVIAERSGARSLNDLPVGFEVRIPIEELRAEYLPPSDPRRREFERRREGIGQVRQREVAADLAGVAVILDAGHGGRDRGAIADGVWESDYVYDVLCRIRRRLETTTRARVVPLVRNATLGWRVRDRRRLEPLTDTDVLTHPPYRLDDPVVGVNLRWFLAGSLHRKLLAEGIRPGRIVFASLHADSLHPSARGAMVYVPGAEHTGGWHGRRGPEYERRREVRELGRFRFSEREREQAEGLSRQLAERLLEQLRARGLPVHDATPVRGSVLRNGREWLPAVLRSNPVPARILLEVVNLNHDEDNRLLELPAFRESVAEAFVAALVDYYGGRTGPIAERR